MVALPDGYIPYWQQLSKMIKDVTQADAAFWWSS